MFAIALIHKAGGSRTILCETLSECRAQAKKLTTAFPASYLAATIPYAVYRRRENTYEVSIPFEIKKVLGMELRLICSEEL